MTDISFIPTTELTWGESVYVPGLSYTARTERLKAQALTWAEEGKVTVIEGVPAAVAGTGTVV